MISYSSLFNLETLGIKHVSEYLVWGFYIFARCLHFFSMFHFFICLHPDIDFLWKHWVELFANFLSCFVVFSDLPYFKFLLNSISLCLHLFVGYMSACLHDQRNAKSSPDYYNMPCVWNLHEIFIHDRHVHKKNLPSRFPWLSYAYT